jgi:hypothetical protein
MKLQELHCFITAPSCVVGGISLYLLMCFDSAICLFRFHSILWVSVNEYHSDTIFTFISLVHCLCSIILGFCIVLLKLILFMILHLIFESEIVVYTWYFFFREPLFCSMEECSRYLETIKVYENKPADSIREHMDNDYMSRVCIIPMNPRIILFCNWQINH